MKPDSLALISNGNPLRRPVYPESLRVLVTHDEISTTPKDTNVTALEHSHPVSLSIEATSTLACHQDPGGI